MFDYKKNDDEMGSLIYRLNSLVEKNLEFANNLYLFEEVFLHLKQMILISDKNNNIVFINKEFEKTYGFSLAEVKGRSLEVFKSAKTEVNENKTLWISLTQQKSFQTTTWHKNKLGKKFPLDLNFIVLKNSSGSVINYISIFSDISEQVENEKKSWQQSNLDNLTGLYNRQYLIKTLNKDLETAKRNKLLLALLVIDVDGFKLINDLQGHDAGDKLLVHVAKLLQANVRETDTVSRLSGDELVVVLSSVANIYDVKKVSSELLSAITVPILINDIETSVSASIGIAVCSVDNANCSVDGLIRQADVAVHKAKSLGKNRVDFYEQSMQKDMANIVNIHKELLRAIKNDELRLYYQPVIEVSSGLITGAEALVRWQHPKKGLLFPDSFIVIAEEMGSIVQLGKWVIDKSHRQGVEWKESALFGENKKFQININVSPQQCSDNFKTILEQLVEIKEQNELLGMDDFLQIEVTESMLFNDSENLINKFNEIRGLGFKLLIDDFGTGYSSLSYLKKFPINKLKIDRSFIKDLETDKESRPLVEAIISMSHALKIEVVAEGVETQYHKDLLTNLNCEYMQGYFYSKAVPAKEFEKMILDQKIKEK
jgi:diguanylate cyclase (GGDEF)-like protein/PAS domain S-box-containing protein